MKKLKKHFQQNSELISLVATQVAAVSAISAIVILTTKNLELKTYLGAASEVIKDLGGNPEELISAKIVGEIVKTITS
jgi:hypothetical protein